MSECMHEGMDGCVGDSNVIVCVYNEQVRQGMNR